MPSFGLRGICGGCIFGVTIHVYHLFRSQAEHQAMKIDKDSLPYWWRVLYH